MDDIGRFGFLAYIYWKCFYRLEYFFTEAHVAESVVLSVITTKIVQKIENGRFLIIQSVLWTAKARTKLPIQFIDF